MVRMSNRHEVHAYEYITQPYDAVRAVVLADPAAVFRSPTASGAELHAKAGPFDIAAEVDIQLLGVATECSEPPHGRPATRISIAWRAKHRPHLFPTMIATLSIYPLTPTETQLDFAGVYDPPLGVVGEAFDAIAMHGVAKDSVTGLVQGVARFLRTPRAA
jgi:hypothetical protein